MMISGHTSVNAVSSGAIEVGGSGLVTGGMSVNGGKLVVSGATGNVALSGLVEVGSSTLVTASLSVNDGKFVVSSEQGDVALVGTLNVDEHASITSNLSVNGANECIQRKRGCLRNNGDSPDNVSERLLLCGWQQVCGQRHIRRCGDDGYCGGGQGWIGQRQSLGERQ